MAIAIEGADVCRESSLEFITNVRNVLFRNHFPCNENRLLCFDCAVLFYVHSPVENTNEFNDVEHKTTVIQLFQ